MLFEITKYLLYLFVIAIVYLKVDTYLSIIVLILFANFEVLSLLISINRKCISLLIDLNRKDFIASLTSELEDIENKKIWDKIIINIISRIELAKGEID